MLFMRAFRRPENCRLHFARFSPRYCVGMRSYRDKTTGRWRTARPSSALRVCLLLAALVAASSGCAFPGRTSAPPANLDPTSVLRVVHYRAEDGSARFGLVTGIGSNAQVHPLMRRAAYARSVEDLLLARQDVRPGDPEQALDYARLVSERRILSPVPRPRHFIAVAVNYEGHARETGSALPRQPVIFAKAPESIAGPCDPIPLDRADGLLDYEVELGIVVGRRIPRGTRFEDAAAVLDFLAGFVLVNDVTYRDDQLLYGQWWIGKSHEASSPVGPFLLLIDDDVRSASRDRGFPNVELALGVKRAGATDFRERQRTFADMMHFDVPTIFNAILEAVTLEPGDLISTGTPAGPAFRPGGLRRTIGELLIRDAETRYRILIDGERRALDDHEKSLYLREGDEVHARATLLGEQRNTVTARFRRAADRLSTQSSE